MWCKLVVPVVAALFLVGCEQPAGQFDQLTDANVPYDPSVVDFGTPQETNWQDAAPTMTGEAVAYAQPDFEQPVSGGRVHVVRAKETLFALARMYYNDHTQWKKIYQANRGQISDPNVIKVGMKLVIP